MPPTHRLHHSPTGNDAYSSRLGRDELRIFGAVTAGGNAVANTIDTLIDFSTAPKQMSYLWQKHVFAAKHSKRSIEKRHLKAIAELFQGDGNLNTFKQRELYRDLSNAADRVRATANALEDIIVKLGKIRRQAA
ncbi:hypothetical protein ACH50O_15400 [Methylomonas sp. 2BW1-5-20]|uniref:hypothetical protein n=1 Tax=Methylomonas sp. 2BW1-5-20 TaxID=3376686 RepID=UPI00404FFB9C